VSARGAVAGGLAALRGVEVLDRSLVHAGDLELGAAYDGREPRLVAGAAVGSAALGRFEGEATAHGDSVVLVGSRSEGNLAALAGALPWLRPRTLGLTTSAGLGDRLGLATPGHIRALRAVGPGAPAPVLAQQSIRELSRTGREPGEVLADAAWGAFEEGWRDGFGADADHLKTPADIDRCLAAGYTFFTFDPGDHVDDRAEAKRPVPAAGAAPRTIELEDGALTLTAADRALAAAKYGRAVEHAAAMYRHLEAAAGERDFEVEVSVDETATPTTPAQHAWIALELRRLGVRFVSLAPRFVGRFEKGVDYIGDLEELDADLAAHAAIARALGPYKLSLHSGSDKFSAYPAAMERTGGLVHLKTAGTSWLAALRSAAAIDPGLVRRVYAFARERFEHDRASYDLSARLERAPDPEDVADADVQALVEQLDARQMLHVTFGSVLHEPELRAGVLDLLRAHREAYASELEAHFVRHMEPFAQRRAT
jgi:tagaturonate epimerase